LHQVFDRLFGFFQGKKEEPIPRLADYSQMVVDIHSHLIPGIDDGAKTMDDSIFLLRHLEKLGFKKIITSPHVLADGYKNTPEIILSGRDAVREAMKANLINIQFDATAEYNIDEGMYEKIEKKQLLAFGKNYIMVEMPFSAKPSIMGDIMYKLQTAGYNVILAHPERYPYFHENDFSSYESLKDRSLLFQINIGSLSGLYGKAAKFTAEKMINENMVDFVGSDLHGIRHIEALDNALGQRYLAKILNYDKLLNKTLL
jgi:protein-tyrosine phosphatase